MFDNLETMTITLKSDKAEANNRTRAPDNRTAYANVSIEWIININRAIMINLSVISSISTTLKEPYFYI